MLWYIYIQNLYTHTEVDGGCEGAVMAKLTSVRLFLCIQTSRITPVFKHYGCIYIHNTPIYIYIYIQKLMEGVREVMATVQGSPGTKAMTVPLNLPR